MAVYHYPVFSARRVIKDEKHGPDNGTKPGGERHRREAPSQAKFGYGEREALPQVRCAGKFQARSARNAEREALPQAKFGRGERAALPHFFTGEIHFSTAQNIFNQVFQTIFCPLIFAISY